VNKRILARLTKCLNDSLHDKREQSDINKEFCGTHLICLQKDGRRHVLIDLGQAQLLAFRKAWR
jgi:hypothetical protein